MKPFFSRIASSHAIPALLTLPALLSQSSYDTVKSNTQKAVIVIEEPASVITNSCSDRCLEALGTDKPKIIGGKIPDEAYGGKTSGGDPAAQALISFIEGFQE